MPLLETLCIFTASGRTFTFKEVNILTNNESVLVFNYRAVSDAYVKEATFLKSRIVGWSVFYA